MTVWSKYVLREEVDKAGLGRFSGEFPDPHKTALIIQFLDRGWRVEVLALAGEQKKEDRASPKSLRVRRVGVDFPPRPIDFLRYGCYGLLYSLLLSPAVVYAFSDGVSIALLGVALLARLRNRAFVLDYRNPPLIGPLASSGKWQFLLQFAERLMIRMSALTVAVSSGCAEVIQLTVPGTAVQIVESVLPSGLSRQEQRAVDQAENGRIRFCYWGSITRSRDLSIFLRAFLEAPSLQGACRELLFVGTGDAVDELKAIAHEHPETRIEFYPWMDRDKLWRLLKSVDVAVVPLPPSVPEYRMSSPLKIAEAFTLDIPVLTSNIEAGNRLAQTGIGLVAEHSVEGYVKALSMIDDAVLEKMRNRMRELKNSGFVPPAQAQVRQLVAQIDKLLTRNPVA